ncbi:YaiI/YqxD family protein [Enterococcus dispar]|uniref:YaiI/YqxD family protein n=1 Tax=Enterococcus dispar TaxID=44009 RepID=UPI0018A0DCAA|nr:YaiI/YqxD family protein [Enterococcus dispar]
MRFVVDGDGSPVKKEVIALAKKYRREALIVTSVDHYTTETYRDFVHFIYVDKGADSADYRIVKEIQAGDWVITQDYGLASLVLPKGARVFHHSGKEYLPETIDQLLEQRYLGAKLRKAGQRTKGPKAFTSEDRQRFVAKLEKLLKEVK